jgi:hypothetical protein
MGLLRFMGENEPGNLLRGIIVHPDAHISRSWYRNRKVICAVHWVIVSDVIIYFYKASDIDAPENSYVRSADIIRIIHPIISEAPVYGKENILDESEASKLFYARPCWVLS